MENPGLWDGGMDFDGEGRILRSGRVWWRWRLARESGTEMNTLNFAMSRAPSWVDKSSPDIPPHHCRFNVNLYTYPFNEDFEILGFPRLAPF